MNRNFGRRNNNNNNNGPRGGGNNTNPNNTNNNNNNYNNTNTNNNNNNNGGFNQRNNNNNNNNNNPRQPQQRQPMQGMKQNRVVVQVSGHDPNWDFKTFQSALNSKTGMARWLSNNFSPGQKVVDIALSPGDAQRFVNAVHNAQVGNVTLVSQIKPNQPGAGGSGGGQGNAGQANNAQGGGNQSNNNLSAALQQTIFQQHGTTQLIDLQSLPTRLGAKNVKFSWEDRNCTSQLLSALLQFGSTATLLTLANNQLDFATKPWMSKIFTNCPKVSQVDLTGNQCSDMKGLVTLLNDVKHNITTLVMDPSIFATIWSSQNFGIQNNLNFSVMAVHTVLLDNYPLLKGINNSPVVPFIKLTAQRTRAIEFPEPVSQFIDPQLQTHAPSSNSYIPVHFIQSFLAEFDGTRVNLASIYNDTSTFSVCLSKDINSPADGQLEPWADSGVTVRNGAASWTTADITRGQQNIMNTFGQLPQTMHDLDTLTLDSVFLGGAEFLIQINGRLQENAGIRGFSRSFVVRWSGGSYLVKSDMLYLDSNVKKVQ
jgi:hypothetical protein